MLQGQSVSKKDSISTTEGGMSSKGLSTSEEDGASTTGDLSTKGDEFTRDDSKSREEDSTCTSAKPTDLDSGSKSKGNDGGKTGVIKTKSKAKSKSRANKKNSGTRKLEVSNFTSKDTLTTGTAIQLLDKTNKVVGTGRVAAQLSSHGHDIPDGYLNIEVTTIASNVKPLISSPFDDEFLCVGQFTPWPLKQLQASVRSPINTRNRN